MLVGSGHGGFACGGVHKPGGGKYNSNAKQKRTSKSVNAGSVISLVIKLLCPLNRFL